ncbi:MAG: Tex family protein [Pseudomonadales bacterium]|nr:Tex family protein [Pseudomonadales bacterium]
MPSVTERIATELGARPAQIEATVALLDAGDTVPFIARYRKEATGGLDDVQLRTLAVRLEYLRELEDRRRTVLDSVAEQGKLTPELEAALRGADTKQRLEDLYLPYRPRRRTRAQIAREAGLEPLAERLLAEPGRDPAQEAEAFLRPPFKVGEDEHPGVPDVGAALEGARWILMERFAEDAELIGTLRTLLAEEGLLHARVVEGKEEPGAKFRDYFAYSERIAAIPSHRALALLRGRAEDVLRLELKLPEQSEQVASPCEARIAARFGIEDRGRPGDPWLAEVVRLCWRAKLAFQLETELIGALRQRAEDEAIRVFGRNLEALLLSAPAGARPTLGLDPGIRTGVKVAVVDATGKVLATDTVYPFEPRRDRDGAIARIVALAKTHGVELVAIGNGTASRETERLLADARARHPELEALPVMVSEAGASVYSASELASRELPDLDVSLRGAVSIARRLQDPLAELVKIDPKSIGVGQYQHDVGQTRLARALEGVVEDCVNRVGVDLNTASPALLARVAGLTPGLAENIVAERDRRGAFPSRRALLDVPRLGPRTFEQAAGFLRVRDGDEPLDASAVHPEAYPVAARILEDLGLDAAGAMRMPERLRAVDASRYVDERFGLPTVQDILAELEKPGRDPRPEFRTAAFREGVETLADLVPGMRLEGAVTNVTNFGAFVDVGVHQDGLVHISQLADRFVKDPHEVVRPGQVVQVRVLEVDVPRRRIALTMRSAEGDAPRTDAPREGARGRGASTPGRGREARDRSSARGTRATPRAERRPSEAPAPTGAMADALRRALREDD